MHRSVLDEYNEYERQTGTWRTGKCFMFNMLRHCLRLSEFELTRGGSHDNFSSIQVVCSKDPCNLWIK